MGSRQLWQYGVVRKFDSTEYFNQEMLSFSFSLQRDQYGRYWSLRNLNVESVIPLKALVGGACGNSDVKAAAAAALVSPVIQDLTFLKALVWLGMERRESLLLSRAQPYPSPSCHH